jgi:hypothetical protein
MNTLVIHPMNLVDAFSGEVIKEQIKCEWEGVTMVIPKNPANRHYAEILQQVEAGTLVIQEAG